MLITENIQREIGEHFSFNQPWAVELPVQCKSYMCEQIKVICGGTVKKKKYYENMKRV